MQQTWLLPARVTSLPKAWQPSVSVRGPQQYSVSSLNSAPKRCCKGLCPSELISCEHPSGPLARLHLMSDAGSPCVPLRCLDLEPAQSPACLCLSSVTAVGLQRQRPRGSTKDVGLRYKTGVGQDRLVCCRPSPRPEAAQRLASSQCTQGGRSSIGERQTDGRTEDMLWFCV
ncbi:hypothetical protein H920_15059 [Fukomys damarensis]|uniref:Uncharacterized protein n=1 Tax=Fukomys damarensis TaxID=885580 RepID=A0A091CXN3_FUKDA|nr:hypothetical protein H920_15059 [Fukomys damarensis]